jgi:hypothetical protein
MVDDSDYEFLNQFDWTYYKRKKRLEYAIAWINGKSVRMHKLIMGLPPEPGLTVDHINGDRLDNRRMNLRWATRQQQCANRSKIEGSSSKYRGVYWDSHEKIWRAEISGRKLGCYYDEVEAAKVYNKIAKKRYGEFAKLNIIED